MPKKPYCEVMQGFDEASFNPFFYVNVYLKDRKPAILVDKGEMVTFLDRTAAELAAHNVETRLKNKESVDKPVKAV